MDAPDYSAEVWKPVAGWEGCYRISDHGRLMGIKICNAHTQPRIKTPKINKWGYFVSCLFDGDRRQDVSIHVLVAETFIGQRPPMHQVNHIDGKKANNHFSNLEWVTAIDNIHHAINNGLRPAVGDKHPRRLHPERWNGTGANFGDQKGSNNGFSKLDEQSVRIIRKQLAEGKTIRDIAKLHNVTFPTISRIKRGASWKHVLD